MSKKCVGCNNPISKLIIIPKGKWFKFLISNHSESDLKQIIGMYILYSNPKQSILLKNISKLNGT